MRYLCTSPQNFRTDLKAFRSQIIATRQPPLYSAYTQTFGLFWKWRQASISEWINTSIVSVTEMSCEQSTAQIPQVPAPFNAFWSKLSNVAVHGRKFWSNRPLCQHQIQLPNTVKPQLCGVVKCLLLESYKHVHVIWTACYHLIQIYWLAAAGLNGPSDWQRHCKRLLGV